jgi:hypothetical protein
MDSSGSDQDVPQRVLDMVRMFLASSTRGDHTVLTLETRNQQIVTKYRSVETVAGNSATTASTPATDKTRKTVNPARARRSRLRLEQFQRKKENEKQKNPGNDTDIGDSSNSTRQLLVELGKEKKETVETGPYSPILQVDGLDTTLVDEVSFSFKSEYGEEDIRSSLEEIFPPFMAQLDSRVRLGRMSADHLCKVSLRRPFGGTKENLSWPEMTKGEENFKVFRELKKIA